MNALSIEVAPTLAENEAIIARGLATFREVGEALLAIRDGRQYLEAADDNGEVFTTFEDYCRERWGMSRAFANYTIQASEIVATIVATHPELPVLATESQARALAPIKDEPELMAEVLEAVAVADPFEPITAAKIAEAVEAVRPHVAQNAGNNEWYTPKPYIESATQIMGGIDLDPASSESANAVVGASRFHSIDDDGLNETWAGRIWMNPPYAQPAIGHFCDKLVEHYSNGEVTQACVLVNNATETTWFQTLASVASAICFPKGRVRFWEPGGALSAPLQGQAVVYLGGTPNQFQEAFACYGLVVFT